VANGITKGVKNALARNDHHSMCSCGFALPKYPGRYPKVCPSCGADRSVPEDDDMGGGIVSPLSEGMRAGDIFVQDGCKLTVVEIDEGIAYCVDAQGNARDILIE